MNNFFHVFLKGLTTVIFSIGALFGYGGGVATKHDVQEAKNIPTSFQEEIRHSLTEFIDNNQEEKVGSIIPIAGATYNIAGAGISSSATSITLTSLTIPQTGQELIDSDLPDTFYITLEPGNRTKQEIASCTTVTQNSNNTATLSGCARGLAPITPYTASSTLAFSHNGASQVIFSDPPQLYQSIISYVDGQFFGGIGIASETATGTVEIATGAEAALGTTNGSLGRLALPASLATSTYNSATAANVVPVTLGTGLLDQGFLPSTITKNIAVTAGTWTFSGSASSNIGTASTTSFTSTFVWTKPTALKQLLVEVIGGGAAGANDGDGGGGGGGGAYCKAYIDAASLSSTVTMTVGAATAASSVGTLVIAGAGTAGSSTSGGAGGDCSGSITAKVQINNFDGGSGFRDTAATPDFISSGHGGDNVYGRGGQNKVVSTASPTGEAGSGYGAGGSGGVNAAGGAGSQGLIILTEIFY